jgi:hypothetical protein
MLNFQEYWDWPREVKAQLTKSASIQLFTCCYDATNLIMFL